MARSFRTPAMLLAGGFLVLAAIVAGAKTGAAGTPAIQGDANCDGVVSPSDALSILLHMAGDGGADCVQERGDTDCGGDVNGADALSILRYFADQPASAAPLAAGCAPIGSPLGTPTPSPSPTPTATPGCGSFPAAAGAAVSAAGTPQAGNYTMVQLPADAGVNKLTNIVPVPGDPGLAVITTEDGMVWSICLNSNRPRQQMADMTDVVRDFHGCNDSDEGLVGFAFDPTDLSTVYIDYSMPKDPPCGTSSPSPAPPYLGNGTPAPNTVRSRISRFHIVHGQIDRSSETVILDIYQPWEWHNGDGLVFGPDGMLYIGSGDGGLSPAKGQTLNDLWGAILRIDVHSGIPYAIPSDNPFVASPTGAAKEVWAYGLRNPWRFSFDSATGKMWLTDVGENSFEEVDIGRAGANYGWNVLEGYQCSPASLAMPTPVQSCNTTGLSTPRAVYPHSDGNGCAIQGGNVYHGSEMPELDGYFIYGDFCSGRIWGLDTQNDQSSPILLADSDIHPVSWAVTSDGDIVAVNYTRPPTFGGTPGIYKLQRLP